MIPLAIAYGLAVLLFAGLPWSKRVNPGMEIDRPRSRRTGLVLGIVHLIALIGPILAAAGAIGPVTPGALRWSGVGLMIAAPGLQQWAQRSLGDCFTLALQSSADQRLSSRGPYAWIRHPAYLAQITLWIGLAMASGRVLAIVLVVPVVAAGYGYRIVAEEEVMLAQLGERFVKYASQTRRLLPFLW